jgi:hypothetical protein
MEKVYLFNNKYYSEQDILTMISFYEQYHFDIVEAQWYNILLNANIYDLPNLCKTNKLTYDICQQKQFWNEKGLPQSVFNLSARVSDRVKLIKITKIVDLLITLFNNDIQTDEGIYITFDRYNHLPDVQFLLPLLIN